jgi:uncharacterized membrane protein YphA (DoxX/SURF4 family)
MNSIIKINQTFRISINLFAMKKSSIIDIISFLLLLLFVYTATSKIIDYESFYGNLRRAHLQPFTRIISFTVPTSELVVSALLVIPRFRKWGLYGGFILMSIFTSYVIFIFLRPGHLPCSCGGIIKQLTWQQHLVFNSVFTILSLLSIRLYNKQTHTITANYKTKLSQ